MQRIVDQLSVVVVSCQSVVSQLSIASRISRKNKKNKIIILFLTKYELCCVNDNDVDVLSPFWYVW